ncbi:MAG: gfo/Idh/MocA family oxidoreductase [Puniceicoccaceae bacterium]|nr:MAG: gfo/Idh/MocA family oxidoreductase [Puniceicoccaceae bacterium]
MSNPKPPLRFAILGTGFWARYQLAAWREIPGAECVALYNRTRSKAEALAAEFGIPAVYDDPKALLGREKPDFVDIITGPDTHAHFVGLAAEHGIPAICQKPFAPTLAVAEAMTEACRRAGVDLLIHENWRWQTAIRRFAEVLHSGRLGRIWRARIAYDSSFPVFENQPFLKEERRFILMDVGTHVLDAARFLFGEAAALTCRTHRVNPEIKGEDAASILLDTTDGPTVFVTLSYASRLERERFPQTTILVEGEDCSAELTTDYWIRVTDRDGTRAFRAPPPYYPWADPRYDCVFASIPPCHANLLAHLRGEGRAETTAEDNLKTLRLVEACYRSADSGSTITLAD